jgi:hypothetical protein
MVVFSSYFRKGIPTGAVLGQVKLVICYWPNPGQRVATSGPHENANFYMSYKWHPVVQLMHAIRNSS